MPQQQQQQVPFLRSSSSCSSILRLRSANSSDDDDDDDHNSNNGDLFSVNGGGGGSLSSKRTGVTLLSKEHLPSLTLPIRTIGSPTATTKPVAAAATLEEEDCVIQGQAYSRVFLCELLPPSNGRTPPAPEERKEDDNTGPSDNNNNNDDDDDDQDNTTQDTDLMSTGSNEDSINGNDADGSQEQQQQASSSASPKKVHEKSPKGNERAGSETDAATTTRTRPTADDADEDSDSCTSRNSSTKLPAEVSLTPPPQAPLSQPAIPPQPAPPLCFAPYTLLYMQWTVGDDSTNDDPKTFVETQILSAVRQLQSHVPIVVARQPLSDTAAHHNRRQHSSIIKLALSKDEASSSSTIDDDNSPRWRLSASPISSPTRGNVTCASPTAAPCISSPVRSYLSEDSSMLDDYISDDSQDSNCQNGNNYSDAQGQQEGKTAADMARPTNLYLVIDRVYCPPKQEQATAPLADQSGGDATCLPWMRSSCKNKGFKPSNSSHAAALHPNLLVSSAAGRQPQQQECKLDASSSTSAAAVAGAWKRHVAQEQLAEQLARHVAAHPQLRFHCQGITVGVVTAALSTNHNHSNNNNMNGIHTTTCSENAALPGLEACRQALLLGQKDRSMKDAADAIDADHHDGQEGETCAIDVKEKTQQPSRSHIGLVAPHPQALTQRLASAAASVTATISGDQIRKDAEATTTTASTTLLQTLICAEWNGQGNLTSFARRAHRLWRLDCGLPFERDPVVFRKVPKRIRRALAYGYAVKPPPPPSKPAPAKDKSLASGTLTRLTPSHLRHHPHHIDAVPICTEAEETLSELAIIILIGAYLAFHYYDFLLDGFTVFMSFFLSVCNPLEWDDLIQRLREL